MAAGTPVIVSENTGSKEAVRPGEDGFIVPIRDAEAIAERLVELYRDPGRRCWMGENASLRSDDYSWPAYFAKMKVVYETVAGAPRRAEVDA